MLKHPEGETIETKIIEIIYLYFNRRKWPTIGGKIYLYSKTKTLIKYQVCIGLCKVEGNELGGSL